MRHHVMLTVVAVVCALALASRASAQAATTPSGRAHRRPRAGHSWADGPRPAPRAQFALLEGNPAEAVPLTLRLKFPPTTGYRRTGTPCWST